MNDTSLPEPPPSTTLTIGAGASLDPRLLEVLVCPVARTLLTYDRARQELVSAAARLAYPVRDGVPILIVDEARRIED